MSFNASKTGRFPRDKSKWGQALKPELTSREWLIVSDTEVQLVGEGLSLRLLCPGWLFGLSGIRHTVDLRHIGLLPAPWSSRVSDLRQRSVGITHRTHPRHSTQRP